ncbi:MAG: hypothetical protein ACT4OJ_08715 [Bacteroidota bacterium]
MQAKTSYTEKGLIISIPTNCPEALHLQLLTGITASLKQHLLYPLENRQQAEAIASLADLQLALFPTEQQLQNT